MSYAPGPSGAASCHRCGADLAPGASFCPNCGAAQDLRPRPYAYDYPDEEPARRQWWVPVAIAAGALAALAGGALLSLALLDGDPPTGQSSPSASASASVSASASASAGESVSASPTPSPTPEQAAVIPNLAIAQVVEAVNLRSGPTDGSNLLGELTVGQRLFIIGAPTEADDLRWYRVATVAQPGCSEPGCDVIGFVATPVAEGDEWVEEADTECPTSPVTDEAMAELHPYEALSCFGNNEIEIEGTIDQFVGPIDNAYAYEPEWLAGPAPAYFRSASWIGFRADPDTDLEMPDQDAVVRASGHFEDPAAISCRITPTGGAAAISAAMAVLNCRASFVWTDWEPAAP